MALNLSCLMLELFTGDFGHLFSTSSHTSDGVLVQISTSFSTGVLTGTCLHTSLVSFSHPGRGCRGGGRPPPASRSGARVWEQSGRACTLQSPCTLPSHRSLGHPQPLFPWCRTFRTRACRA